MPATTASEASRIWLLMDRDAVPRALEPRVVELALVSLHADELAQLSEGRPSNVEPDQQALVSLVRAKVPAADIARRLHVSRRTAYRRIEKLKRDVGASSYEELAARLVERGL